MNKLWAPRILFGVAVAWAAVASPAAAQSLELYVVYTSGNRAQKDGLLSALPEDLSVKAYNTNLLALADFSGKQKAIAKLETAQIVVVLSSRPMEHLQGSLIGPDVIIFNTVDDRLQSNGHTVHVVASDADLRSRGTQLSVVNLDRQNSVEDPDAFREADVIVVQGTNGAMVSRLAEIIQSFLGRPIASGLAAESRVSPGG